MIHGIRLIPLLALVACINRPEPGDKELSTTVATATIESTVPQSQNRQVTFSSSAGKHYLELHLGPEGQKLLRNPNSGVNWSFPSERFHLQSNLAWLQAWAPACNWEFLNQVWHCDLRSPKGLKPRLTNLKSSLTKRWRRLPYLLGKRHAVLQRMNDVTSGEELETLCRFLRLSQDLEKPSVASGIFWEQTCQSDSPLVALPYFVDHGIAELEKLVSLGENLNRDGILSIRAKREELPSKDLIVKLKPTETVFEGVEKAAKSLWPESSPFCWHPFYSQSPRSQIISFHLGLSSSLCPPSVEASPSSQSALEWLVTSLQGETVFAITNGRGKSLKLPAGTYEYEITSGRQDYTDWNNTTDIKSTGVISWDSRRPMPVIRKW